MAQKTIAKPVKWAFFISGRGSNLISLLECSESFRPTVVVSNRKKAPGVAKARLRGVPVLLFGRQQTWEALTQQLKEYGVEALFLLGFMRILPENFVGQWKGRILNVHPSLLPAYPGLKSIERAYEDNQPMGVTVHEVTAEVDAGKMILQKKLIDEPQQSGLSLNELEFRIHLIEHRLVREAVKNGPQHRHCNCLCLW